MFPDFPAHMPSVNTHAAADSSHPWWQRHAGLMVVVLGLILMAARFSPWPLVRGKDLFEHPYRPFWDETFQAVLVERHDDPAFLPHDAMIDAIEGFWPDTYFNCLVAAKHLSGSLETAILVLSFLFAAFFLCGCWRFSHLVTGSPLAAAMVTLASAAFPRDALVGEWGVDILVPRLVTLAAAPWLFEALARCGLRWRSTLLFLVLGLLANIHSVSALHLVGLLACAMLLTNWRRATALLALGAVFCILGALPVLLHFGGIPTNRPPDPAMVRESSFAYIIAPFFYKATMLATGFALLAIPGVIGFLWALRGNAPPPERYARRLLAGVIAMASLHGLTLVEPALLQYSPLRVTKYLYLFVYIYGAFAVARLVSSRSLARMALAAALAAFLMVPAGPFLWARLRRAWPAFDARCIASARSLPRCFAADVIIPGKDDDTTARPAPLSWERFHRLARAVRQETPKDALFLLPPRGFSPFRLYARRSALVLGEDSVVGLYDADAMREWHERMDAAISAFESGDPLVISRTARHYAADHVILRPADPDLPGARTLWSEGNWRVVRLGD